MVSGITIRLESPICMCAEENLLWSIEVARTEEPEAFLVISCGTCHVEHSVPANNLLGHFDVVVPYPGATAKPAPKLEVLEGGKVIELCPVDCASEWCPAPQHPKNEP